MEKLSKIEHATMTGERRLELRKWSLQLCGYTQICCPDCEKYPTPYVRDTDGQEFSWTPDTDFNQFTGAAAHAITCDFCHKIVDVDVSPEGIKRPNLVVGTLGLPAKTTMLRSPSEPQMAFGPL